MKSRRKPRKTTHRKRRRKLQLETLAARQMMAADLALIQDGFQSELFEQLQDQVNHRVFRAEAPLVGSQLATEAPGQFLTQIKQDLAQVNLQPGVEIADVEAAIEKALSGKLAAEGVSHQGNDGDSEIRFRVPIQFTKTDQLDADLGLGDQSMVDLLLGNEDAVDVNVDVTFDLEFGVREKADGSTEFFVVTGDANEIRVVVDAKLMQDFDGGTGRMGVFIGEFSAAEDESIFQGTYVIDIDDPNRDGLLLTDEFGAAIVDGTLSGNGEVNLDAEGSFLPTVDGLSSDSLFNLAVVTQLKVEYEFDAANTGLVNGQGVQTEVLGKQPKVSYVGTRLDLGTLFADFIDPVLTGIRDILMPTKPVVDFLTDPLPVIGQYTDLTFLSAAQKVVSAMPKSASKDEAQLQLDRLTKTANLMNRILDYKTPGTGDLNDATKGLGSVSMSYQHVFGEQDSDEQIKQQREQVKQQVKDGDFSFAEPTDEDKEPEHLAKFQTQFSGDLRLPLLTESNTLVRLLYGDSTAELFEADMNFEVDFLKYEYTVPLAPLAFLANGEFRFELEAGLDLGIGFDAQGVADFTHSLDFSTQETFELSKEINKHFLDRGFYVDDNNALKVEDGKVSRAKGQQAELPEMYVRAKASVGGSLGPDFKVITAKAGILGTLAVDVNLDLNDLPNTLPPTQWVDPFTPTRPNDAKDWQYDGHIRMDELREIVDYDPTSLVNASGQVIVGVDAFAQAEIVGISLVDYETTLAETPLFDFDISTPNDQEIIEKVDQ